MNEHLKTIAQQFDGKRTDTLKDQVGRAIATLFQKRTKRLYREPAIETSGLVDKAIMYHLKKKAVKESRPQFLARLHAEFWAGEGGNTFAENCGHRFEDLFLERQQQEMALIRLLVKQRSITRIVELGCNSGTMINYLVKQMSRIESAIGIDINQEQISRNCNAGHFDPRIQFVCADANNWIIDNPTENTLFVSNGGVMEYFSQDAIEKLLHFVAGNCRNSIFFSVEPVAVDHRFSQDSESQTFGSEHSFSHDYRSLFRNSGFDIVFQRHLDFEEWRMLSTIAVCNPAMKSVDD